MSTCLDLVLTQSAASMEGANETAMDIMLFRDFFAKNVAFVHMNLSDTREAIEIFNSLNELGALLTAPQLLKSGLLNSPHYDESKERLLASLWNEAESEMRELRAGDDA